ncbi:CinA family protein [Gimibacter soli]|uniref:CinA family protein n=1 Tax=Gimibacter soli TaxID=3024400 RepID=A0AAF0BL21_9PROT|nr:CinA family protein [Gimibacter soli]WCL52935.1 CinA family protein [Gimibacter soli]
MPFDADITVKAERLLALARAQDMKLATAESCTGGLIGGALTAIAGSSDVVDRGFITYSNEAKQQMLGVSAESLARFGAVSEAVAKEMAYGALAHSMADAAVAVTGVAGPGGGSEEKPVGLVWFGIAVQGQAPEAFKMLFGDIGRDGIRTETVRKALDALIDALS